jgi:alpha-N-arabinofuranosidase
VTVGIVVGSRPGALVSPHLFGANLLWAYNAEGSFDSRTGRFYPGFVAALRRIGVTALRYPGGTTSDSFFWERAVGPVAARRPNEPYGMQATARSSICCVLDGPAPSLVGPDEYGRLLGALGAQGTVTVNFATGTATQAADFVAYMTAPLAHRPDHNPSSPGYWAALRARDGHSAPYDVRYWEVGNEQLFPGQYGWRSGGVVRLGAGAGQCPPGQVATCLYVYGGTTAFFGQRVGRFADQLPFASLSAGTAGQRFYVYFPPIVPHTLSVFVAGRRWSAVGDLAVAPPGAPVYSYDNANGEIAFGNGRHGAVPPAGSLVTASYQSGPHQGFLEFYRAMKRMVPAAQVCESEETDQAFLALMGSRHRYDCVELHLYARPSVAPGNLVAYDGQLMASVANQGAALAGLQSAVRRYSGRPVPVVVTEYGQLVSPVPSQDPQFNLSLEEGVFNAAQLVQWALHDVPLAEKYLAVSAPFPFRRYATVADTNTAMVESGLSVFSAMVVHRGLRFVVEPSGEAIGLLRRLAGYRLLPLSWREPGGRGGARPAQAYAMAAAVPGGGLALAVVNGDPGRALAVRAVTALAGRYCDVTSAVLDGPAATAYNTPAHPFAVGVSSAAAVVGCRAFAWSFPAHSVSVLLLAPRRGALVAVAGLNAHLGAASAP